MAPPVGENKLAPCVDGLREIDGAFEACKEVAPEPSTSAEPACVDGLREVDGAFEACKEVAPEASTSAEPACVDGLREIDGAFEGCGEEPAAAESEAEETAKVKPPLSFGSVYIQGGLPLPAGLRKAGPILQNEWSVGAGTEVRTRGGTRLRLGFAFQEIRFGEVEPPEDKTRRYAIQTGLAGDVKMFGVGKKKDILTLGTQNSLLELSIYDHHNLPNNVTFGVVDQLGVTIDVPYVGIGLYLQRRDEFGKLGAQTVPERVPFSLQPTVALNFNFERHTPTKRNTGDDVALSLMRTGIAVYQIQRGVIYSGPVTQFDGQRDQGKDLIFAATSIPSYAVLQGNIVKLFAMTKTRQGAGIASGLTAGGGLLMEIVGIAVKNPLLAGYGAALTCGGVGSLPGTWGAEKSWVYGGMTMACGAVQTGTGIGLVATAGDLGGGANDPVGGVDDTDHDNVRDEGKRAAGLQVAGSGIGGIIAGIPIGLWVNIQPKEPKDKGPSPVQSASIGIQGRF